MGPQFMVRSPLFEALPGARQVYRSIPRVHDNLGIIASGEVVGRSKVAQVKYCNFLPFTGVDDYLQQSVGSAYLHLPKI